MLQDYKLGVRMRGTYPGLTMAGGLALAIAIGIGAGWYDLLGKLLWPTIPLPDGDRIVVVETHNALTNRTELRVARDFLEWRSEVGSIDGLGAYRTELRNLSAGNTPPVLIRTAALTAAAFRTARVTPLIGRGLIDADETPGAPGVIVLGFDVWQRSFEGRSDVVGSTVKLGSTQVAVVGSRWSRRTPNCACSGNGRPRHCRRHTRTFGRSWAGWVKEPRLFRTSRDWR
jgi:putative ABC transport system permease protein